MTTARAEQLDFYTELHEGRSPRRAFKQALRDHPRELDIGGRIVEIQYSKLTAESDPHDYNHPFAEHAQPKFGFDENGDLWIYTGRYVVTTHGIEDLPASQVRSERLPHLSPRELTDLGKLEFIRYISNGESRTRMIRFPSRPVLSVDEHGDLHVLIKERSTMARRHRKHHHSFGGKRRHHRRHARSNPSRSGTMEAIKGAAILGSVAAVTMLGIDYGLTKYNASRLSAGKPALSDNMSGAIEIAVGLGGAALIAKYGPKGNMKAFAAGGIGAGGVASGLRRFYAAYQARQIAASQPPASSNNPANRVLPAGIPQGYNARTRAACAA